MQPVPPGSATESLARKAFCALSAAKMAKAKVRSSKSCFVSKDQNCACGNSCSSLVATEDFKGKQ